MMVNVKVTSLFATSLPANSESTISPTSDSRIFTSPGLSNVTPQNFPFQEVFSAMAQLNFPGFSIFQAVNAVPFFTTAVPTFPFHFTSTGSPKEPTRRTSFFCIWQIFWSWRRRICNFYRNSYRTF